MRVFLDTDAASRMGRMEEEEKRKLRRYVQARFSWCVSPLTFAELSLGRSRGHDWDRSSQGLHELQPPGDPADCLPFPSRAVQLTVTGRARAHAGWEPKDLQRSLTIATTASSPADLKGHDLDTRFLTILEAGEQLHRERLKEARASKVDAGPFVAAAERYAGRVATACDIDPTPEHLAAIVTATDAALRHDSALWSEARARKRATFQENVDDWVDGQQLLLLALPDVHFLTADERLRKRLVASSQYHRVLSFEKVSAAASRQP